MSTWEVPFPSWVATILQVGFFFVYEDMFHFFGTQTLFSSPEARGLHPRLGQPISSSTGVPCTNTSTKYITSTRLHSALLLSTPILLRFLSSARERSPGRFYTFFAPEISTSSPCTSGSFFVSSRPSMPTADTIFLGLSNTYSPSGLVPITTTSTTWLL